MHSLQSRYFEFEDEEKYSLFVFKKCDLLLYFQFIIPETIEIKELFQMKPTL